MSSFTSFDELHFSGLNEKRVGRCELCQDEVEFHDNTCSICGNDVIQSDANNNNTRNGFPFGFGSNGIDLSNFGGIESVNLDNPDAQQAHTRRIIELLSNMGLTFPSEGFDGGEAIVNCVSKSAYDQLAKFKIKTSIEEHRELRSDAFIVDGLPETDMFSITIGAFGNGTFKHSVKYKAILANPINAHEKMLINSNEVQGNVVVCLRGKSSFAKKARLCESLGASGILVVNTLSVWPFTMGDSTGEGKGLKIPTAMCRKNDGHRIIEMLKQKNAVEITFNIPEAKDTICGICLDTYEKGNEIVQLPCLHFFHDKCISSWFKVNNSCPICRKEVWDTDEKSNNQQQQRRRENHADVSVRIDDMYL